LKTRPRIASLQAEAACCDGIGDGVVGLQVGNSVMPKPAGSAPGMKERSQQSSQQVQLTLGELADPRAYRGALDITGRSADLLQRALQQMVLIRVAEDEIGKLAKSKSMHTPCHLGIGQEAIAVGVSTHLTAEDRVFGTHRSHAHFLAMGGELYALLAEVLGRTDGACRGMGGSMHLFGGKRGFHGSVPIVGATIPMAVGAGLAARLDATGAAGRLSGRPLPVGVCYFGDGTSEEGVLHESMNLAAIYGIPVLFVCENNLYSSHLDISLRQPYDRIARFAEVHSLPARTVDGNDVLAVADTAAQLLDIARSKPGPVFLEAVTYRWRGHVGPETDEDVGVRRSHKDLVAWMQRDPIKRLSEAMVAAGMLPADGLAQLEAKVRRELEALVQRALAAPFPPASQLLDLVYSDEQQS
jgi:pyruvate dehydrogenase E1 component alpha subunit